VRGVAEERFTVTYDGAALAAGRMSVRDLAPALLALADAIREANHVTYPGEPDPVLNIEALREGSFSVELILMEGGLLDRAMELLTNRETNAAVNLATLVTVGFGGFNLIKRLSGRRIRRQDEQSNGRVKITFDDGTTLTLPAKSVDLAQSRSFRESARQVVAPLEREGVEELRLEHALDEPVHVTPAELPGFEIPAMDEEPLGESTRVVALQPVTIAFLEGNKWRVTDGETTFYAIVQDPAFIQRVQSAEETFAITDILEVRLRTKQWRGADGQLRTENIIERVIEHRRGPRQIPLPLEFD
jgi:hypothetical protein